ncbi:MAG: CarD family transcriptional regulator [Christensenellales bacterium]|jgi:CarD family transcriptional regulator
MYSIGDKISYPMYGAGIVESIERQEVLGETRDYYVLTFMLGGITVKVPIRNVSEVGMRNIISKDQVKEVIEHLKNGECDECQNWNRRYRENLEKLRSGNIFDVADVVRMLSIRDKEKGLSTGERKMLSNARQILLSELSLASGKCESEVEELIEA